MARPSYFSSVFASHRTSFGHDIAREALVHLHLARHDLDEPSTGLT